MKSKAVILLVLCAVMLAGLLVYGSADVQAGPIDPTYDWIITQTWAALITPTCPDRWLQPDLMCGSTPTYPPQTIVPTIIPSLPPAVTAIATNTATPALITHNPYPPPATIEPYPAPQLATRISWLQWLTNLIQHLLGKKG